MSTVQPFPSQPSPPHPRIRKKMSKFSRLWWTARVKTPSFGVNRLRALSSTAQTGPSSRGAVARRHGLGLQEYGSHLMVRRSQSGRGITSARKIKQKIDPSEIPGVLRWPLWVSVTHSCESLFKSEPRVRPKVMNMRVAEHIFQFSLPIFTRLDRQSKSSPFGYVDIGWRKI